MAFAQTPQPTTIEERVALANQTMAELNLKVDVWVDDLGDQSRAMFGDLPHAAIVIDPKGTIRLKLSWCDPLILQLALTELAAPSTSPCRRHQPLPAWSLRFRWLRNAIEVTHAAQEDLVANHGSRSTEAVVELIER